jgi:hypothetical protein
MNPTEQAHQSLRQVLLTGRILVNGMPLTANELSGILQGEQMLYEKASRFDKAQAIAGAKEKEKAPKEPKIIPLKQSEKKE